MKKRWISVMALVLGTLLVTGCGGKTTEEKDSETDSGQETVGNYSVEDYVTLGEYKGLENGAVRAEYDEAEVELQTRQFYFSHISAESGVTDRAVELLDMTNIDYEGKKDGVAFEGGTAKGASLLIGSGQFIDGFEEGLIGVMPGETVDLNLRFPDGYGNDELAGQEVVFTVTVNYIEEMEDASVAQIGIPDVSTVAQLRAYVEDMLNSQAESEYLAAAQDSIFSQILENAEFGELPEDMIAENREAYASMLDRMAAGYGMDGKTYVEMYGGSYEDILDEYAVVYTKQLLVIQAIANKESLNISDEDLDARMSEYAEGAGITVDDMLTNGLTKEDYRQSFLYEDVMGYLVENAVNTAQ